MFLSFKILWTAACSVECAFFNYTFQYSHFLKSKRGGKKRKNRRNNLFLFFFSFSFSCCFLNLYLLLLWSVQFSWKHLFKRETSNKETKKKRENCCFHFFFVLKSCRFQKKKPLHTKVLCSHWYVIDFFSF